MKWTGIVSRRRFSMQIPLSATQTARQQKRQGVSDAGKYILLMILVMLFFSPFVWLVVTALKTTPELAAFPIHFLPLQAQWDNFALALTMINYGAYATNSLILSTIYSILTTLTSALVGFGFARLKGKGKYPLFMVMLSTLMLPQILTVIPTYVLFARLNLIDTYWPWVLWGLGSSPYLAFLFRQFFSSIPSELEE